MSRTVRLNGLSADVTTQDLRLYFAGLEIPSGGIIIIGGELGVAYIEFTTSADAQFAVRLSGHRIKGSTVYIYPSSIAQMERTLENHQASFPSRSGFYDERKLERQDSLASRTSSAPRTSSYYLRITAGPVASNKDSIRRFFERLHVIDIMNTSDNRAIRRGDALVKFSNSIDAFEAKRIYRHSRDVTVVWSSEKEWMKYCNMRNERGHPRSPEATLNKQDPIYDGYFHVLVENLDCAATKQDLKKLFNILSKDDIKFLHDEKDGGTKACFLVFKRQYDFKRVLQLNKVAYNGSPLFISPISKSEMIDLLTGKKTLQSHYYRWGKCIYLRNFTSSVAKRDVQEFFAGFSLNEEDISLLCDKDGVGLGEVVVTFSSEEVAANAQKLHRKKFQDRRIVLKRVPEEKLQNFLRAKSVRLMADPYDCVTQEDDTPDEDETDDNMPDEDSGFHQTDNTHVYVTQEDDEPDTVHVDDAPSTSCILNKNIHVDNGNAVPRSATSKF